MGISQGKSVNLILPMGIFRKTGGLNFTNWVFLEKMHEFIFAIGEFLEKTCKFIFTKGRISGKMNKFLIKFSQINSLKTSLSNKAF